MTSIEALTRLQYYYNAYHLTYGVFPIVSIQMGVSFGRRVWRSPVPISISLSVLVDAKMLVTFYLL